MNSFRADLHCHSTCSDGMLTPQELIELAKKIGLSALSITDHDTIDAYPIAIPLAQQHGITLIPGVEFSTVLEETSIHILGYGMALDNPDLLDLCHKHKNRRQARNQAILDLLTKHGMPLTLDDVFTSSPSINHQGKGSIGRPHIALAMVAKGYVADVKEAFTKYIAENKPCYSQGVLFSVEETIDIIHSAGGVAVIAHPHLIKNNHLVNLLLQMPFDGIECYYWKCHPHQNERWLKIAKHKNLLITGGSDFHGDIKPNLELGSSWIGEEHFNALQRALQH